MKTAWGIVTDEVMADPVAAIQAVATWGLRTVEIRGTGSGRRVPDITEDEVQTVLKTTRDLGLGISALSPGTWKCCLHDEAAVLQLERFVRTLDLAEAMGVGRIISFAVQRSAQDDVSAYRQVVEHLGQMCRLAQQRGITLCIENERGWWADSEPAIMALLRDLATEGLRLNWDAANFVDAGGTAGSSAFRRLCPWIENIHLKDVCTNEPDHRWCLLGTGQVGWAELLPAMLAGERRIPMSIETHCPPLLANSAINRDYLRQFEGV